MAEPYLTDKTLVRNTSVWIRQVADWEPSNQGACMISKLQAHVCSTANIIYLHKHHIGCQSVWCLGHLL